MSDITPADAIARFRQMAEHERADAAFLREYQRKGVTDRHAVAAFADLLSENHEQLADCADLAVAALETVAELRPTMLPVAPVTEATMLPPCPPNHRLVAISEKAITALREWATEGDPKCPHCDDNIDAARCVCSGPAMAAPDVLGLFARDLAPILKEG